MNTESTFPTDADLAPLYSLLATKDQQETDWRAECDKHRATGMDYKAYYALPDMVAQHVQKSATYDLCEDEYERLCELFVGFKAEAINPSGFAQDSYQRHVEKMRLTWERAQRAVPFEAEARELKAVLESLPTKDRSDLRKGNFAIYVTASGTIPAGIYEVTRETPKRSFAMAHDLVSKAEVKLAAKSTAAINRPYDWRHASGYKIIEKAVALRLLAMHEAING